MHTRQLASVASLWATLPLLLATAFCPMLSAGEAAPDEGAGALMNAMISALAGPAAAPAAPAAGSGGGEDLSIAQKLVAALASVEGAAGARADAAPQQQAAAAAPGFLAGSLLTPAIRQRLLDVHNRLRSSLARGLVQGLPPAANMALMEWDDRLAATANDWAGQCTAKPDSQANRAVNGLTYVAQSLGTDWLADVDRMVGQWFDQKPAAWDPATGGGGGGGGSDFRQLASASSRLVGCALQDCRRATGFAVLLVCNYGGGGSDAPVGLPYAPGAACRACPTSGEGPIKCMLGLCASERVCNGGMAASCVDAPCIDDPECTGQQPASFCRSSDAAVSRCPKLCAACGGQQRDAGYRPLNAGSIIPRVVPLAGQT